MKRTTVFAILGFLLGIPFSYYFQSGTLRKKMGLGDYIQKLPELIEKMDTKPEYATNVLVSCIVFALVLGIIGYVTSKRKR